MNNNDQRQRPRFVCRAVRRWEALCGGATEQTRITERHLEVCDACQEFFAEDLAFEDMMRSSARGERADGASIAAMLDGGFEQRILRAVRESAPEAERGTRRAKSFSIGLSFAGAAAGMALAFIVAQRSAPEKPVGSELVSKEPASEQAAGAEDAVETPLRWWRSLDARESALELAKKNPLQQEIDSISTDAQSVLGFLAMNFLPTDAAVKKPAGDASQG